MAVVRPQNLKINRKKNEHEYNTNAGADNNISSNLFENNTYGFTGGAGNTLSGNNFTRNEEALSITSSSSIYRENSYDSNSRAIKLTSNGGYSHNRFVSERIVNSSSGVYDLGVTYGNIFFVNPSTNNSF